jgi:DNA repair exonuclease SbcCD ATPase subunit
MSLEKQKELVASSGALGLSIPGLSLEPIIKNIMEKSKELKSHKEMIEEEVKENKERGMDPNEAKKEGEKKLKELIEKYKKSLKEAVEEQITLIKQHYKNFKEGLESIPEDVKAIIANILLPPTISAPPAAPNPIYALNLAKTTKNSIAGTLSVIIISFTEILKAANKILFLLPEPILSLFEKIKTVSQLISSIPI